MAGQQIDTDRDSTHREMVAITAIQVFFKIHKVDILT